MDAIKTGRLIRRLRQENAMTQLQLARQLHISDKTVSKWERGESVPDLDKLLKLSGLFGISLDELVRGGPDASGGAPGSPVLPRTEAPPAPARWPQRRAVGLTLLCVGAVLFVVLLLFLGPGNAALLSSPLWVCGGLCLICRRHPALWCAWAGYAIVYGYLRVCTGIRFWWALCAWLYRPGLEIHAVLALAELLGLLALAAVTVRTFRRGRKQ